MAVKHQLPQLDKLFPVLAPRYIGDVLTAYMSKTQADPEVNRVFTQQLLAESNPEPSASEIDSMMQSALNQAIGEVEMGGRYSDTGNGLYRWLYARGDIRPTEQEWNAYLEVAQRNVKHDLINQKSNIPRMGATPGEVSKRGAIEKKLSDLMQGYLTADYIKQVRSDAMRLCLHNYLLTLAEDVASALPATPTAPAEYVPYSHTDYIEALERQLPDMDDEAISNLQRQAKDRNLLDVYKLTTDEWNRRTKQLTPA
jgi:hypothetical protein